MHLELYMNFNLKPNLELNLKLNLKLNLELNLELTLQLNLEPSKKLSGCLDCSFQIVVAVCRLQFAIYLSQLKMLILILKM